MPFNQLLTYSTAHIDDNIPTSPRKKPRKQLLNANTDIVDDEIKAKAKQVNVEVRPTFVKEPKTLPKVSRYISKLELNIINLILINHT